MIMLESERESGASGGETPFSRRAHEENKTHVGGKVDGKQLIWF